MNILLVSPKTPDTFWSFRYALPFVSRKTAFPPLGLLTIAAMLPHDWNLSLVDLDVAPLRDADILRADCVMLSAMIVHRQSVETIARRCAALNRPVIAGGPLFTTGHEGFPDIPHFVLGEAEKLMEIVVRDLTSGRLAPVYRARGWPALDATPVPRWDLIDFRNYACLSVQFSRGCPFNCEFCDIIVMNGRVPRTKAPDRVIRELEAIRTLGWDAPVFLVDDNFIGNRNRVKGLLREMIDWRRRTGTRMTFLAEASVNLAADPEMLALMVEAGFEKVFLGIETPELESLKECHKNQNTGLDLMTAVRTIQAAGVEVMGGFIVGFDNDGRDIFDRQFEFIQNAGIVTAMVGILTALPKTRLYRRLMKEGRLLTESSGNNTEAACNFRTKLDRKVLLSGYHRLMTSLYEPRAYYRRIISFLSHHRPGTPFRVGPTELRAFLRSLWVLGVRYPGRGAYWSFLSRILIRRPRAFGAAVTLAIHGHHFRRVAESL